jgi:hypothetical protein
MSGKKLTEFKNLLTDKMKSHVPMQTEWVKVSEVDWEEKTMTAIGENNGLEYFDVLLGLGAINVKPKVGTLALVGAIHNGEACFMISCEEIEEIVFTSSESEFTIKENGFIVKQGDESLKTVLNDLIIQKNKLNDEVAKIVVSIGITPNVPVLTEIKEATNQIKDRLNNILIE